MTGQRPNAAAKPRKPYGSAKPTAAAGRAGAAPQADDRTRLLLAAALIIVTALAYLPALRGDFIWDDDAYVSENAALLSAAGLRSIWFEPGALPQYYPLTFTSFWIEHHLWGNSPLGYHLVNLGLHLVAAFLTWRITAAWWGMRAGWMVAALFALHPLHVESVAWITERKNVLSGACYLGAALLFLRGSGLIGEVGSKGLLRRQWYPASLALFVGALLSKTVTATLPAALLLVLWWRNGALRRVDLLRLAPLFVLGIAFGLVTAAMERGHVGASGADWNLSWMERVLIAGRALWFYAGKLLWPHPLLFIYPRWTVDSGAAWQFLFPLGAALAVVGLFAARKRIGRGPLCAALFFAGTLFPALGFVDVYPMRFSFVADHFCYLASLGLLALLVGGLSELAAAPSAPWKMASIALLAALALLTWNRSHAYAGLSVLWRDTIEQNPSAWIAHSNLGSELIGRSQLDAAEVELREALRLKPDLDDAHNNLGVIALQKGHLDEALLHFSEAVRITPGYGAALANLAGVLQAKGRLPEAIARYREALQTQKRDRRVQQALPALYANLGAALESSGDPQAAVASYREALRLNPGLEVVRTRLAALEGGGGPP